MNEIADMQRNNSEQQAEDAKKADTSQKRGSFFGYSSASAAGGSLAVFVCELKVRGAYFDALRHMALQVWFEPQTTNLLRWIGACLKGRIRLGTRTPHLDDVDNPALAGR